MKMIIPAALIALALSAPALAMHRDGGRKLMTSLSGAMEVPGPGDTNGTGKFSARVNSGQTKVCYKLSVAKLATPTMAHIHRGALGVAGPVVVALKAPASGKSSACAMVTRELAKELLTNPEGFYVNVHNAAYPAGAMRGQLMK
jgi:hypothetical protein